MPSVSRRRRDRAVARRFPRFSDLAARVEDRAARTSLGVHDPMLTGGAEDAPALAIRPILCAREHVRDSVPVR